jgi:cell division protease FtsH
MHMSFKWTRNNFVYLLILVAVVAIFFTLFQSPSEQTIPFGTAIQWAQQGKVERIEVRDDSLTIFSVDGVFTSSKEPSVSMYEVLVAAGVTVGPDGVQLDTDNSEGLGGVLGLLINFLPLVFLGILLMFIVRQAQGSGNQTLSFGRSRARIVVNKPNVTFDDVAGVEESKRELQEVVEFLRYPERFTALGARIPRGILLVGAPGTGKTLLAKAVAGEAGVPFFSLSGSEFVEMFVGVGASRVRDLFEQAKRNAPCIVFVDEIDAVGRHRGAGLGGGHDEREQTLNQILVEMDGFDTVSNVIILAATNRPDILDPALLRPGRFDRRIVLDAPDIKGREAILTVHAKGKPLERTVDLKVIARETSGFSGADLANLINEAALLAARDEKTAIGVPEFEEAIERVVAGPERKSRVISDKEKEVTAYHEAGHALVGWALPNTDPVHKVSIVSRGSVGGYTRFLPEEDRNLMTRSQFEDMLAAALGGRVAEEVTFGDITTGATNDLENATRIARQMVTRFGMSEWTNYEEMAINEVIEKAMEGKLESIEIYGNDLLLRTKEGSLFRSRKENDFSLVEFFADNKGFQNGSSPPQIIIKNSTKLGGLGPRTFGRREEMIFLGREITEQRDYSEQVAQVIDEEVHSFIQRAYDRSRDILITKRAKLVQIARYLIKNESVEGAALTDLFESDPPPLDDLGTGLNPQAASG